MEKVREKEKDMTWMTADVEKRCKLSSQHSSRNWASAFVLDSDGNG